MIEKIITNENLTIYFQPIVSIKNSKLMGVEALMRAWDANGEILSPTFVFDQAKKENLSFELDTYVRKKSIEAFSKLYRNDNNLLLFLNFESHLLNTSISFEEYEFDTIAKNLSIPSKNIVLEIKENKITNLQNLQNFCSHYKEKGFIIALDDFGAGSANFDRISKVRPHIVKIDRSLIFNVHQNFINKEILKSIANMCFSIGSLVLAEGVEDEKEILKALKLDIDIFQGFWFGKPSEKLLRKNTLEKKILYIGTKHTKEVKDSIQNKNKLVNKVHEDARVIINLLFMENPEKRLFSFIEENPYIEAIYMINEKNGIQLGNTIIKDDFHDFFTPASNGDNHSMKEYFYITKESKRGSYLSQKYISRASGRLCQTYAQKYQQKDTEAILCIDLKIKDFLDLTQT